MLQFHLKFAKLLNGVTLVDKAHPTKINLNKMWLPKQKTIQNFNIDQGIQKNKR